MKRLTPLEWSHGLAWVLGGLFTLCWMELGWLAGVLAGFVGIAIRIVVENRAMRAQRDVVLSEWFGGAR